MLKKTSFALVASLFSLQTIAVAPPPLPIEKLQTCIQEQIQDIESVNARIFSLQESTHNKLAALGKRQETRSELRRSTASLFSILSLEILRGPGYCLTATGKEDAYSDEFEELAGLYALYDRLRDSLLKDSAILSVIGAQSIKSEDKELDKRNIKLLLESAYQTTNLLENHYERTKKFVPDAKFKHCHKLAEILNQI